MFCPKCGAENNDYSSFCSKCGNPLKTNNYENTNYSSNGYISDKSSTIALLLCIIGFFGVSGIHRFYVGKVGTGLLMLFTAGGFGIWTLIDAILIGTGSFYDSEGLPLRSN